MNPFRRKASGRIKTDRKRHHWEIVGGYDPELDGEDRRCARYAVHCSRCGEQRRVGAAFDDFLFACGSGCARGGFTGLFKPGDQVIVRGGTSFGRGDRLDTFTAYLPGGQALTSNAGGGVYTEDIENLQPDIPEGP